MKKIVTGILKTQEVLGTVLLAVFFIAIILQIGARYLAIPLLWTEEVANYSFIWAVFMGASAMVHHRAHFSFTFFSERFKGPKGHYYKVFLSLFILCFTIPMTYYGIIVADTFWNYNWITLPWVQMGYTWLCLPIMGATMTLYTLCHIASDLRAAKTGGAD